MADAGASITIPVYDGVGEAKQLLRAVRAGALATLDAGTGYPFASLVTVATDFDGSPLLLLSRLSAHTRNLEADPRCSILLARGGKGDPLAHPRLTAVGSAAVCKASAVRGRFLRRHPKASLYADFADFAFWRIELAGGHLNGGFAKAAELTAASLRTDLTGAEDLLASEEGAVSHMNEDHADALGLYATRLAGEAEAAWKATGIDPEGLDMSWGDRTARIVFPHRITTPRDLRMILKHLADEARAATVSN